MPASCGRLCFRQGENRPCFERLAEWASLTTFRLNIQHDYRLMFLPMYRGKKIAVVMPAYNAEKTLKKTYDEVMGQGVVDLVVVVDDRSRDQTAAVAQSLPKVLVHVHEKNTGYGGIRRLAIVSRWSRGGGYCDHGPSRLSIHPHADSCDGQHDRQRPAPCVLGGVHHGRLALRGGMPGWKYLVNRFLSCTQNLLMSAKLSEYHTGYRACSRELMESMRLENLSDDFIFDKQFLPQVVWLGFTIGEVSCPTKYSEEVSSINFRRSLKYGLGWLGVAWIFRWHKWCGGFPRYIY